jgi:crossover junction endodeoxyribonuclease RuvC
MRVLGIDPGTINLGYAVLEEDSERPALVECGVLRASPRLPLAQRLLKLHQGLLEVLRRFRPGEVALEEPFIARGSGAADWASSDDAMVSKGFRAALAAGEAQAIVLLAAAAHKVAVAQYSPSQVKLAVTGYGRSTKEQVQQMVKLHLGLDHPPAADAADAVAVALCHLFQGERRLAALLRQEKRR